jgi:hypothetical protein
MRAGIDVHPDLEVMGSCQPDTWARCHKCGRWFWLTTDDSKWQYYAEWEIDGTLAERAFVQGEAEAAARLLVSSDLPEGPLWTSSSALLEMLRAVTPRATDRERSRALAAAAPTGRWAKAARLIEAIATGVMPAAPELPFALDLTLAGRSFGEWFEVGSALVLFQTAPTHALVRIDGRAVTESTSPGPLHFLGHRDDALLFGVTTPEGVAVGRIDAAGTMTLSAPSHTRYGVFDLDDGHWLFLPADGAPVRDVELRGPDAQPRVKLRMGLASGVAPPRRMGDGWIVSGCVDEQDQSQALTLLDGAFQIVAQSRGARGHRLMAPADATSLWAETIEYPYALERWVRRGEVLERTFCLETQGWIKVRCGVVACPRDVRAAITGYDDAGQQSFRLDATRAGATYFAEVPDGLLVYDDASARTLDPRTGKEVADPIDVEAIVHLLSDRDGTSYLQDRVWLWVFGKTERTRIFVGERMRLETTCGDCALLRDDAGDCLVIGSDGARGRFSAPGAQLSVIGTRGGPYLVEGARVRVARFAQALSSR